MYSVGYSTSSYSSIVSTASIYEEEEVCNIDVDSMIRRLDHDVGNVMIQGSIVSSKQLKPEDISVLSGDLATSDKPSSRLKAKYD